MKIVSPGIYEAWHASLLYLAEIKQLLIARKGLTDELIAQYRIGWDAETQELHVRFAPTVKDPLGPLGAYACVDPDTAESVMNSPSIGSALNSLVKGQFIWRPAG